MGSLDESLTQLGSLTSSLGEAFGTLIRTIDLAASRIAALANLFRGGAPGAPGAPTVPTPPRTITGVNNVNSLMAAMQKQNQQITQLTSFFAGKAPQAVGAAGKSPAGQPAGAGKSGIAGVAGGITGMLGAIGLAKNGFMSLANLLRGFVDAFNPSAIFLFDLAMRDLTAVIGRAVTPIFNVLTSTIREVSSILLPMVEQLQPVIARVAGIFQTFISGMVAQLEIFVEPVLMLAEVFAQVMEAMRPLGQFFQALNSAIAALVTVNLSLLGGLIGALTQLAKPFLELFDALRAPLVGLQVILQAVATTIRALFKSLNIDLGLDDLVEGFKTAMIELTKAMILAAVALAKVLGFTSFVDGIKKALDPKAQRKDAGGQGAARDAKVGSDILAFARQVAQAATTATVVNEPGKSTDDLLKEIKDGVIGSLDESPKKIMEEMDRRMEAFGESIGRGIKKTLAGNPGKAAERVIDGDVGALELAFDPFSFFRRRFGGR